MSFDFTVAVFPNGTSMKNDLRYVKSALLYADKVTLISPLANLFSRFTDNSNFANEQTIMLLLQKMLDLAKLNDMATYNLYASQIEDNLKFIRSKQYSGIPYVKKLEFKRKLKDSAIQLYNVIFTTIGTEQCTEMSALVKSGKVIIEEINSPMDEADAYVTEYYGKLRNSISSSYALFDEMSNNFMANIIGSNIIRLSDIEKRNVTHAGFADNVIQRLPSFETATTDEIISIGSDLNRYIIPFRKAMLEFSEQIHSMPWDGDFRHECQNMFDTRVAPKIHEIEQAVHDNNVWKNLCIDILKDPKNLVPIGGLAIGVLTNNALPISLDILKEIYHSANMTTAGLPFLISAIVMTPHLISKITESLQSHKQAKRDIEKNDCYFYYEAKKTMSKL